MNNHLAIECSKTAVRFVSLKNQVVVNDVLAKFNSLKPNDIKDQLSEIVKTNSFLSDDFQDVTLSWSEKKSTLVPSSVFSESSPLLIFGLCFGKQTSADEIDYNRISELSVVNIFEIPLWIKSFFVVKFPRVILQHEGTHVLRKTMDHNAFKLKATAIVHQDFFQLSIVKHNQLEFYSFFDMQSAEDVIYHLLFVLQQKELSDDQGTIELIKGLNANEQLIQDAKSGFEKIQTLKKFSIVIEDNYISKAQQLCV
ncbi:MAG: DUF3822 family protein [Crocinitomicaceae bacterium]|nr:DUF3822 family protein [Crocinitomicaceae bacterium]